MIEKSTTMSFNKTDKSLISASELDKDPDKQDMSMFSE